MKGTTHGEQGDEIFHTQKTFEDKQSEDKFSTQKSD